MHSEESDSLDSTSYSWQRKRHILVAFFLSWLVALVVKKALTYKRGTALGRRHECQPCPELPYSWPLGLDRITQLWAANAEGRLLAFLCSIADGYEPRNQLSQYLLLGPRAYHILNPRNLEAVLSINFKDYGFGARSGVFAPLLGKGIFTQEGVAWKHSRDLLRKQFIHTRYQKLDHVSEHVDNLFRVLPREGIVDLQPLFFSLTLDTTTALLFGKSVYSLSAGTGGGSDNRLFAESFNIAQDGLAKRFRLAPWQFLYNPRKFQRACANVHHFVERYIDSVYDELEDSDANADSLYFFSKVAGGSASKGDLRDQLLNVLLAGRDTTACCLSWTFRLLVRHPWELERLRNEIHTVVGLAAPTRDMIKRMPFLACIIKESLRLYPPVPLNNRTAVQTTILPTGGGPDGNSPMLVRKGELVVFSQYVNSRRKSIYGEDAAEFRPDRWETGELDGIGFAYFPFHGGSRQCLGEDFAITEISYSVVRLLQAYPDIALPDDEFMGPVGSERQVLTLVLSPADGCRVRLSKSGTYH
ncbi:cytochrome P450 [Lophiostoma macrostomum CBS 122681]|uniref:Cytochrome P450 n=1 Tax=Lophiostoma macrostomum CBS 122681 TaxID=1314788 RepID=A0A6A6TAM8_9PLEO|nr:cytochrome P450 [Lophiostoma macrostomum CBS 122681]